MNRKQKLDELTDAGYKSAKMGIPIDAAEYDCKSELERAAWENGWRLGRADTNYRPSADKTRRNK